MYVESLLSSPSLVCFRFPSIVSERHSKRHSWRHGVWEHTRKAPIQNLFAKFRLVSYWEQLYRW